MLALRTADGVDLGRLRRRHGAAAVGVVLRALRPHEQVRPWGACCALGFILCWRAHSIAFVPAWRSVRYVDFVGLKHFEPCSRLA